MESNFTNKGMRPSSTPTAINTAVPGTPMGRVNSTESRASFFQARTEGGKTPTRRNSISVKLTKTSSARPVLYSELHREALMRVAEIIQEGDNARVETTKGKLPVEAAYVVMKRVTEAAGLPIVSAGMSTFNKLNTLRTDPALQILKKNSWRDFFSQTDHTKKQPNRPSSRGHREKSPQVRSSSSLPPAAPESDQPDGDRRGLEEAELRQQSAVLLNELAMILIERIRGLWQQLKIPAKERTFYEKSICALPVQSAEQCKELARLVAILQQHERNVRKVLASIRRRELAVEKCTDVLVALHRKFAATAGPSSSSSSAALASTDRLAELSRQQVFWKEELVLALCEVRATSVEVVRDIQEWRRSLWRPLPFVWMGRNYLLKMKEDFAVLESHPSMRRIFESLPLRLDDLQAVYFPEAAAPQPAATQQSGAATLTPSFGRPQFSPSPRKSQEGRPGSAQAGGSGGGGQQEQYIAALLLHFQSQFDFLELQSAVAVVQEEAALQKAIALEEKALTAKGVFIPILRPLNDREAGASRSRSASPVHGMRPDVFGGDGRMDFPVPQLSQDVPNPRRSQQLQQVAEEEGRMRSDADKSDLVVARPEEFSSIRRPASKQ